jgi:hypothetical protein
LETADGFGGAHDGEVDALFIERNQRPIPFLSFDDAILNSHAASIGDARRGMKREVAEDFVTIVTTSSAAAGAPQLLSWSGIVGRESLSFRVRAAIMVHTPNQRRAA